MYWFTVGALIVCLIALVWGYRKDNRNVLAAAALLLLVAGAADDFVAGFQESVSPDSSASAEAPESQA